MLMIEINNNKDMKWSAGCTRQQAGGHSVLKLVHTYSVNNYSSLLYFYKKGDSTCMWPSQVEASVVNEQPRKLKVDF